MSDHGANVQRTRVYVWSTSADASNLVSTTETSTDGLKTWNTIWNAGSPATSQGVTVYAGGGNRYLTNIASDSSFTVSAYQYGQLASVTKYDANRNQLGQTTYAYDEHGRQNTQTDTRNGTTTNYFNNADQASAVATPSSGTGTASEVTSNYFDNMGRIWKTTLPDGTSVTNLHDVTGLVTHRSGSREYPLAYTFDAQGRLRTMTTWTNYASNQGQAVTTWNYDIYRGWLTNKSYADGHGPKYTYTPAGRLATRTWARGTITTYLYSTLGDLSAIAYSDGTIGVTNGYDRRGRQASIAQGSFVTARAYDDAGDLLGEAYTGGPLDGLAVTNIYDSLLRRTTNGILSGSTWLTQSRYAYDAGSRFLSISNSTNSAWYSYLANSPLVSQICFTNGNSQRMVTSKQYDFLNRLTSITNTPGAAGSSAIGYAYAYNAANQRTAMTNADSSRWAYSCDPLGQVTSGKKYWSDGTHVAGQQFEYAFDDIGNRRSAGSGGDTNGSNLRVQNYTANSLNQYASRTVPGYIQMIGMAATNATVVIWGDDNNYSFAERQGQYFWGEYPLDSSWSASYRGVHGIGLIPGYGTNADIATNSATGHQYVPQSPESFTYDLDGNLTSDGRWQYTWDAENRLIKMEPSLSACLPFSTINFAYDSQGRRIHKGVSVWSWNGAGWTLVPASTNRFAYDGWNMIEEFAGANVPLRSYVWGTDLSGAAQGAGGVGGLLEISQISNSQITNCFVAFDGNGNVTGLVDATNGTLIAQYEYGPFGEVIRATGPMARANRFRFSTKYQDDETDQLYYGYRYYNASTGRWTSRDPYQFDAAFAIYNTEPSDSTANDEHLETLYLFDQNHPLSTWDYLGLLTAGGGVPSRGIFEHRSFLTFTVSCSRGSRFTYNHLDYSAAVPSLRSLRKIT